MHAAPFGFPSWTFLQPLFLIEGALFVGLGLWFAFWPPRPNGYAGSRLPWTFADDAIWYATNRCTGWVLLAAGLLIPIWWPAGVSILIIGCLYILFLARGMYVAKYGTARTWRSGGCLDAVYHPVAKCPSCGVLVQLDSPADLPSLHCPQCDQSLLRPHHSATRSSRG
jgi:predicted RNA-binding Zn-ribbon protein involved in translation (DUF1610 family)